jgi:hypothetical protein
MAFYPPSILFSVMRISPILMVVLILALIMHYFFKIQEHWRRRDVLVCGLLMGVNALLEPTVILFYIAGCVWLFLWSFGSRMAAVKSSAIMAVVCVACILPWTIRNYVVFDTFVPVKSSAGWNLLEGNHPYANGVAFGSGFDKVFSEEEFRRLKNLSEVEENKAMQRKAIEFIKADPPRFIQLTIKRMYYYWSFTNPYWPTRYDALRIFTYGPVLVLAATGLLLSLRKWREASLFLALFISYPLFYYATQVTIYRYRYAPEAFLLVLASYAALELVKRFGARQSILPAGQQYLV